MATLSEELSTLKELLDKGIMTQEEFESKKAQLLAAPAGSLSSQVPSGTDDGGVGWLVLGLFIPIVGLILYLVWKDTKPLSAQQAGKGALIGFIIGIVGYIALTAMGASMLYSY